MNGCAGAEPAAGSQYSTKMDRPSETLISIARARHGITDAMAGSAERG